MDVKIDPRTGIAYWLDLNPRIGRGHYYLKVAQIDLVKAMFADMEGRDSAYQTNGADGIYTVIPMCSANRNYLRDGELYDEVKRLRRRRRAINPLTLCQGPQSQTDRLPARQSRESVAADEGLLSGANRVWFLSFNWETRGIS